MASHRQFNIRPRRAGKTTKLVEDYLTHIRDAKTLDGQNGIILVLHNHSYVKDLTHTVLKSCEALNFSEELAWYAKEHIVSAESVSQSLMKSSLLDESRGRDPKFATREIDRVLMDEYLMWTREAQRAFNDFMNKNPRIGYVVETTGKEVLDRKIVYLTRFFREHYDKFDITRLHKYLQKDISTKVDRMWHTLLTDPKNSIRADFHDLESMMDPREFYLTKGGIWSPECSL